MPAPTSRLARVRMKSVYEPSDPSDGRRVLATRYWPRGVAKAAADEYAPTLAPSRELLHGFKSGRLEWSDFRRRYLGQMRTPEAQAEIRRLTQAASSQPVTLMCVCRDAERCHRTLLRELIAAASADRSSP